MVVVGKIGDDLRMDYTAIGDTTNVAARLQGFADRRFPDIKEIKRLVRDGIAPGRSLGHVDKP
jgi:predicted Rdx family selenoprotein